VLSYCLFVTKKGYAMAKKYFLLFVGCFLALSSGLGAMEKSRGDRYPKYEGVGKFYEKTFLALESWGGIACDIREKYLDNEEFMKLFFKDGASTWVATDDEPTIKFVRGEQEEKIKKLEEAGKLEPGSFYKAVKRAEETCKAHLKHCLKKIFPFCKKNKIEILNDQNPLVAHQGPCYMIKMGKHLFLIRKTFYGSIEKRFRSNFYHMQSRVETRKRFDFFKGPFDLKYFYVQEFRIMPVNEKDWSLPLTDNDCILVGKYKNPKTFLSVKSIDGKALMNKWSDQTLKGDEVSAKRILDLLRGLYLCAIWEIKSGYLDIEKKDKFVVRNGQAPGLGGSGHQGKDQNGKRVITPPWEYPNEIAMERLGRIGIELVLKYCFNVKWNKKDNPIMAGYVKMIAFYIRSPKVSHKDFAVLWKRVVEG